MEPFAIEITLYGEDDEVKNTYRQNFIPFRLLKEAFKLAERMGKLENPEKMTPEVFDDLADFIVALFRGRFSREELENGASMDEAITVLRQVMARISSSNPT